MSEKTIFNSVVSENSRNYSDAFEHLKVRSEGQVGNKFLRTFRCSGKGGLMQVEASKGYDAAWRC